MNSDDWRLQGQESYMLGVVLTKMQYSPASSENDHDHCEFCFTKFMVNGANSSLASGYTTEDRYRWVCEECYQDFKEMFKWQ